MSNTIKRSSAIATSLLTVAALGLAGCAKTDDAPVSAAGSDSGGGAITIGTTDKITGLDPAGTYDNGSFNVQINVYPFLMSAPYGKAEVEPDIAESAEFTSPTEYTVKLKPGLKFANGHDLTSSDVKFTFERQVNIAHENGPSTLLGNMEKVEAPDDTTVVFTLKSPNDQTWPQVLSSPAAPIVDEETFSATELTPDDKVVEGQGFAGPYAIQDYKVNELVTYTPNKEYQGLFGAPKNSVVTAKYYTEEAQLKLAVEKGDIDVAFRSLSATDIESLRKNENVVVEEGPGGEERYLVFNDQLSPFGSGTDTPDAAKNLAVKKAIASLIDRQAIADQVYKGTYTPLYSPVPEGFFGATSPFKTAYGDGNGGPSTEKAKQFLDEAGVTTPVALHLQYNPDHYGASSGDEYALIKQQLEEGGLFTVELGSTEWVTYNKERIDSYPIYQLGWFPDFSDADNYLSPFFTADNFIHSYAPSTELDETVKAQSVETDHAKREELIKQAQELTAAEIKTLPLLQGTQIAVRGKDIKGVADTLDPSFKFHYGAISK